MCKKYYVQLGLFQRCRAGSIFDCPCIPSYEKAKEYLECLGKCFLLIGHSYRGQRGERECWWLTFTKYVKMEEPCSACGRMTHTRSMSCSSFWNGLALLKKALLHIRWLFNMLEFFHFFPSNSCKPSHEYPLGRYSSRLFRVLPNI